MEYFWGPSRHIKSIAELKYLYYTSLIKHPYIGGSHYDQVNAQVISENYSKERKSNWLQNRRGNPKAGGWYVATNCTVPHTKIGIPGYQNFPKERTPGKVFGYLSDCFYLNQPPLSDIFNFLLFKYFKVDDISTRKAFYCFLALINMVLTYIFLRNFFSQFVALLSTLIYISSPLFKLWIDQPLYLHNQFFLVILALVWKMKIRLKNDYIQLMIFLIQIWTSFEFIILHGFMLIFVLLDNKSKSLIKIFSLLSISLLTQILLKTQELGFDFVVDELIASVLSRSHSNFTQSTENLVSYLSLLNTFTSVHIIWVPIILILPVFFSRKIKKYNHCLYMIFLISLFGPFIFHLMFLETAVRHVFMHINHFQLFFILSFAFLLNSITKFDKFYLLLFILVLLIAPIRILHLYMLTKDRTETYYTKDITEMNRHILDLNYWQVLTSEDELKSLPYGKPVSFLTDGILPHTRTDFDFDQHFKVDANSKVIATHIDLFVYNLKSNVDVNFVVDEASVEVVSNFCRLQKLDRQTGEYFPVSTKIKVLNSHGDVFLRGSSIVRFSTNVEIKDVYSIKCNNPVDFRLYEVFLS